MIRLDAEVCSKMPMAVEREWLETNGLGGYASSTIPGWNTRRYHGLLVAATQPPIGRLVLLARLEESLLVDGRRYELSTNQYAGVVHPLGYRYLREFRLDPWPIAVYEVESLRIEKAIILIHGENTVLVEYRVLNLKSGAPAASGVYSSQIELEIRPLLAYRDHHALMRENPAWNPAVWAGPQMATLSPIPGLPSLNISYDGDRLAPEAYWYRHFEYLCEKERGLDYLEDLYSPFLLGFHLNETGCARMIASTERRPIGQFFRLRQRESIRRQRLARSGPRAEGLAARLTVAADAFLGMRGDRRTILAGYPWFTDWSRDALISLPGITLTTRRTDDARSLLAAIAETMEEGLLPNTYPEDGSEPEYHSVDATLWFFEAVRTYLHETGDLAFVRLYLYDVMVAMLDWYVHGTRYGIQVARDGLLLAGTADTSLTWMDVRLAGSPFTPRHGKAVEIQALWYNALRILETLAARLEDAETAERCAYWSGLAIRHFEPLFWNPATDCLFDVIRENEPDPSIRPNQILTASLHYPLLSDEKARRMLRVVERDLLTPRGLRSLSPADPLYVGRYEGNVEERDRAYHQGSVWAWWMGPYFAVWHRLFGDQPQEKEKLRQWLESFESHLAEAGLGQISEIFDGDPPHEPRGCIAQAWSVAELLRAATLLLENSHPATKV